MPLSAGDRLGCYKILAPIGKGGMGEVFLAQDVTLGRKAALKLLPAEYAADQEWIKRLTLEARTISALNHPNILTIYGLGESDGICFLACEYVEGSTLRQKVGALDTAAILDVARQLALGLGAAHEAGVVHRDVKPENVLVRDDGLVKILDFGLAKQHRTQAPGEETQTLAFLATPMVQGTIRGTPSYMSPEQVFGLPADARSDIFSTGVVLYELLTGRRPFAADSVAAALHATVQTAPKPLAELRPDLPVALRTLVEKALEKEPAKRQQSMRELLAELRAVKEAPVAGSAGKRRRWWQWAAGLAILAAGAWLVWRTAGSPSPGGHGIALLPLQNLSGDPSQEYFADGMTEQLITDLSKIGSLRVISRPSVMRYRGDRHSLKEIAKELGVDLILTGSVMRVEDRVRINAQLVQMPEEKNLWADSFDRDLKDVLTLQAGVARTVAEQIRIQLTPQEQTRLAANAIEPETYELYLRGNFFANQLTEEGLEKGIDYFRRAISRKADYAQAYAGIAFSYTQLANFYRSPGETMPKAREAALKALELDSSLAAPHVWIGAVHLYFDWDWPGAEKELKLALQLNPSSADAHLLYEDLLSALGRLDEAKREAERTLELDPLSVRMLVEAQFISYLLASQYDRTIAIGNKLAELESKFSLGHVYSGLAYAEQKKMGPALQELELAVKLEPENVTAKGFLAHVRALAGDRNGAHRILAELKALNAKRYLCAFEIATVYGTLGEKDEAFKWLEKGTRDRADCMIWLKSEPWMKPLQNDPRFQGVTSKVGLR